MFTMTTLLPLFLFFTTAKTQLNITTTFVSTDWWSDFGGNMFDLENVGSESLKIRQFAVHIDSLSSIDITIYTKPGTYVGYTNNDTAWTQIHFESVTGAGLGNPTQLSPLTTPLTIQPATTQAFFIHSNDAMAFTFVTGGEGNVYVNDGNIAVESGIASNVFGDLVLKTYVWNGIIYYSADTPAPTKVTKTPTISPTQNPSYQTSNPTTDPTHSIDSEDDDDDDDDSANEDNFSAFRIVNDERAEISHNRTIYVDLGLDLNDETILTLWSLFGLIVVIIIVLWCCFKYCVKETKNVL